MLNIFSTHNIDVFDNIKIVIYLHTVDNDKLMF